MTRRGLLLPALALAVAGGCAAAATEAAGHPMVPRGPPNLITAEELASGHYETAYDAVQALRPDWLRRRGTTSLRNPGASEVAVYMAGVRVGGPAYLRQIRAADVASLEHLNATDASNRFGLGHGGGVILIRPREG